MTSTTGPDRLVDIVSDVLARAGRVAGPSAGPGAVWDRLLRLLDEEHGAHHDAATRAAAANLVGLAVFGEVVDLVAVSDLAGLLGHDQLARLQHRDGWRLESDPTLPVATEAVRGLLADGVPGRLRSDPTTRARAASIERACLRAAHALLLQGVDRAGQVPAVESLEELVDIAENGTITEWRQLMAWMTESAWSPYAVRIGELARQAGRPHAASTVAALIDLCREEQQRSERDTVAREVDRLVATSGVPAEEFAAWTGTTPARLAAYASGAAMPSAATMLRISRTSSALRRRAASGAAARAAAGERRLLSVPGGRASRAVG